MGRNTALDTYKLLLAVTIAVFHTRYAAKLGYLAVESFFIINGLMFSQYACDETKFDWKLHMVRRLKAIYIPYALISTAGTLMEFSFWQNKMLLVQYLPRMLFLQVFYVNSGTPRSLGPLWYVPVYLLVFLAFSLLRSNWGRDSLDGTAILLAAFSFMAIIAKSESGGWNYTWESGVQGIIPIGVLRGFMGFSLGYCLGRGMETDFIQEILKNEFWVSILQVSVLIVCVYIMYYAPIDYIYGATYLAASVLLLGTLWARKGIIYYIFLCVPYALSKHSDSIYYCHCLVLTIFYWIMGDNPQSSLQMLLYLCATATCAAVFHEINGKIQKSAALLPQNSRKGMS